METLLAVSLGLNLILICLLLSKRQISHPQDEKPQHPCPQANQPVPPKMPPAESSRNEQLRTIAASCEAKLPEEDRGKVKLLVYHEVPQQIAALQIGDLKISLCRNYFVQSMFKVHSFLEALILAKDGYRGTGRYIPTPQELEKILSQRHIINVYLEAMGLSLISDTEDFWCVDTKTGYKTSWKHFYWKAQVAFDCLAPKSKIRTSDKKYLTTTERSDKVNLILLLKGWEHLFDEV